MKIEGKEIIADEGKKVHRIGQDIYFSRGTLLPNETIEDFEEVDIESIPEPIEPLEKPSLENQMTVFAKSIIAPKTDLTEKQALAMPDLFDTWEEHKKDKEPLPKGMILSYNNNLWRVVQEHVPQEIYPPSLYTSSLYNIVNRTNKGTIDDPIPYKPPMEIFKNKYYIQNKIKYKCTRDSGQALTHDLSALIGQYVEIVE